MSAKVSVLISLYNKQEWVAQAIQSALGQTHPGTEVVVVNDGSTDNSLERVRLYESSIKLITQSNEGASAARNRGLAESSGEFVIFLDADDWLDPDYIVKTLPKMSDPAVGIVATDMQYEGLMHDRISPRGLTLEHEMWSNGIPCCSLVRRAAAIVGYNKASETYEDWNFWIDVLKRGWKVAVVNEPLFHHRCLPLSLVSTTHGREKELFENIKWLHPDLYGGSK
jgi:glycosyltransferase involved in cell wall biosynthesis